MKIFKKIAALAASAAIAFSSVLCFGVSAENSASIARDSVVLVALDDGSYCSGFAVGVPGEPVEYIVTSYHLIVNDVHPTVFFNAAAGDSDRPIVKAVDERNDLAVLKLSQPTDKRTALVLCKSENVSLDDKVYTYGYPTYGNAGKDYLSFNLDEIVSGDGVIQKKTTTVGYNDLLPEIDVFLTSANIDHGNSGGPLVNEKGEAIGVIRTTLESDKTTGGHCVTINALVNLLESNSFPYTLSTDAPAVSNTEDVPAEAPADAPVQAEPESSSSMLIPVIVLIAVVVVAAVIVIVVVMSKNKKAPVQQAVPVQPAAPVQPSAAAQGAVISGMKGFLAGRQFNISGNAIMGRNTQKCSVCFPVDAPGISGVHCEIRKNGGGYEIIDRGSSCGTFLGSGQKLVPDVPVNLPDGTYFYLGSPDQLFQIRY